MTGRHALNVYFSIVKWYDIVIIRIILLFLKTTLDACMGNAGFGCQQYISDIL